MLASPMTGSWPTLTRGGRRNPNAHAAKEEGTTSARRTLTTTGAKIRARRTRVTRQVARAQAAAGLPGRAPPVAVLGWKAAAVEDKQAFFSSKPGVVWDLRNTGSRAYRQIWFELRQPPRHSQSEVDSLLAGAVYPTSVGTSLVFENGYCRAWDFYLGPGQGGGAESTHHHVLDYLFVYVAPGRLLGYYPDGRPGLFDSINDDNDVSWFHIPDSAPGNPVYAHGGKNGYNDLPHRAYLVELK
ncbi:unnamed protein product [Prorocentrum cordatum]|uniref:Uncharacterized protein n=1 Tax=Prorocentrum cordatum TaxID=2364126 RepID=A0ABN9PFJ4_9DINO|nr:unnamed protein product [Polarella glacialis]